MACGIKYKSNMPYPIWFFFHIFLSWNNMYDIDRTYVDNHKTVRYFKDLQMTQQNSNTFFANWRLELWYILILISMKGFTFPNFDRLWNHSNFARGLGIHFPYLALKRSACKIVFKSYSSFSYVNFKTIYTKLRSARSFHV